MVCGQRIQRQSHNFSVHSSCSRKWNCGVRARAVWLEPLILVRICGRDLGQHLLVKQCLLGVGDNPFTISVTPCNGSRDGPLLIAVFKSFTPLATFLLWKQDSPKHLSSVADAGNSYNRVEGCCHLLAFGRCHCHCSFCWRLTSYSYTNMSPTSPGSNPAPWTSGLWQKAGESALHAVTTLTLYIYIYIWDLNPKVEDPWLSAGSMSV